ncbi:MAG: hypothetical protein HY717_08335 [Planctomycetes bacterium]|nr:hypothetical protein [Planctomycetota bacterium]
MTAPRPLPNLDQLAAEPQRAAELPAEAVAALLCRLAAVQTALAGRLALASSKAEVDEKILPFPSSSGVQPNREEEKLERLTVEEASALSKLPPRWFYRHKELSFVERISRKCLRIHKARFLRWLETKRA